MQDLTYDECVQYLIKMLEGYRGNKNAQATYLQTFIQQFGPVPNEYSNRIRKLME